MKIRNLSTERSQTKRLITHPAFIIIAAICALDWLTKAFFTLALSNPIVSHQPIVIANLKRIWGMPHFYKDMLCGKLDYALALGYHYGYWIDYLVAGTICGAILYTVYLIARGKFSLKGWVGKIGYGVLAGAFLANTLEMIVTGKVINWLRISRFFNVVKKIPGGEFILETDLDLSKIRVFSVVEKTSDSVCVSLYRQDQITNLADVILFVMVPLFGILAIIKLVLWCKKRNVCSSIAQKIKLTIQFIMFL